MKIISRLFLRLMGWQIEGGLPPDVRKCVLVAAPHTSNWDFPITMATLDLLGTPASFLGKKELFRPPLGWVMRAFRGIPVDRSRRGQLVERLRQLFAERDELVLMIPPEGTRGYVTQWKSGFYHTAYGAGVPIALGYLDYGRKVAGIGPLFYPTGDFEADLPKIQAFYLDKAPKYHDRWSLRDASATDQRSADA